MPEGPEIRLAADEIGMILNGCQTTSVFFAFEHLKPFEIILKGRTITSVTSRGKAMLVSFSDHGEGDSYTIYSHNQLYGKWIVAADANIPETGRQLRLGLHTEKGAALLYSASEIDVLHEDQLATHPFLCKLGPDTLDPNVTTEEVEGRLRSPVFCRKRLTTLLLDQSFLAGLGNYLRSEILFDAAVHPSMRPVDCDDQQIWRLADASLRLARQSYQTRGITNDPGRADALRQSGWPRRDYRFCVFDRDGQACFDCGSTIVKEQAGGRRVYFCPHCQALLGA